MTIQKSHQYKIAMTIVLVLVTVAYWFGSQEGSLFVSSTRPRPATLEAWKILMAPAQPASEVNNNLFGATNITEDATEYRVTFQTPADAPQNIFPIVHHEVALQETLKIEGGSLRCSHIAVAYRNSGIAIPNEPDFRLFDSNCTEVSHVDLGKRHLEAIYRDLHQLLPEPYPVVHFRLQWKGFKHFKVQNLAIYDAQTHHRLPSTSLHMTSLEQGFQSYTVNMPMWHHTPIDVVIDFLCDTPQEYTFPPKVGQGFQDGCYDCRLVAALDNVPYGLFQSPETTGAQTTVTIEKSPLDRQAQPSSRFVFLCQPSAQGMPVGFHFFKKNGEMLYGQGMTANNFVYNLYLRHPLEAVDRIQAQLTPRIHRAVIHLPSLPGLPEVNKEVTNLLDVQIPYAQFSSQAEMLRFICRMLQLENGHEQGFPQTTRSLQAAYPRAVSNISVRELLEDYPTGSPVNFRIKNNELLVEYPPPIHIRLKQLLDRIF